MDPKTLALKVRRLQSWMEPEVSSPMWARQQFDGPPFGRAEVTVDRASVAPAASFNRNRICLCGAEGGLTFEGLNQMIRMFDAQGVSRFFVWLSPGPDIEREISYLTFASTAKSYRRRGAQSALIAHRVAQARALGCTQIVSQTLTMLTDSFANLQRAGFREIYEQEVFEFVRP